MKYLKNLQPIKDVGLSCFEIQSPFDEDEYFIFEIAHNKKYMVAGSICNVGFMPDFWFKKDSFRSLDYHLQAMYEIINEAIYNNSVDELKGLIEL